MREEARRIAGRLEATLRVPDRDPRGIAVVAHPLPTHGGTMRNPLIASIARACADRGLCALRFNFRGTEGSSGEFTGGREEVADLDAAVAEAREIAPAKPLLLAGFSFGALMVLRWLSAGGTPAAYALLGVPLRSTTLAPQELPPVPDGAFIVQGEHDQFGSAAEVRAAFPRARVHEVANVDHFFVERASVDPSATGPSGALRDHYAEVAQIVADRLVRDARLA
ncbi:MAG TPA: alpha/beta fold hydrolase [Candidatus Limnocylindria bacterium]|nr:alpha/beta fold hydrolase [Candidatus Limnocylindria bacterium]